MSKALAGSRCANLYFRDYLALFLCAPCCRGCLQGMWAYRHHLSFDFFLSAFINHQSCRVAAEARGIFSSTALQGLSPPFQDFLSKCLRDVADRPTVADLLQHRFIKEYNKSLSRRQRELDEAVQALRTHIQIHKGKQVNGGRMDMRVISIGNRSLCSLIRLPW